MSVKLFVGKLYDGTSRSDLEPLFKKFGKVVECDVLSNYGFVHMESEEEAQVAIAALDGYNVRGSKIHVEFSKVSTQGRKRRYDATVGPIRVHHNNNRYSSHQQQRSHYPHESLRMDSRASAYNVEATQPPLQKVEYASEQVKDLLELYFRDPQAFDQYVKAYYYGERLERLGSSREFERRIEGSNRSGY